ncbi:hypothetical protein BH23ACT10_BH23ACT10_36190 [soil metagenome]
MAELEHIAINADDVEATRAFYEAVCGWQFEAWGPPGFYRASLPGGFTVAIQQRRELVPGTRPSASRPPSPSMTSTRASVGRVLRAAPS